MAAGYEAVYAFMFSNGLTQADANIVITHAWDEDADLWSYEIAVPVNRDDVEVADDSMVQLKMTYAGTTVRAIHLGAYEEVGPTYEMIMAYNEQNGLSVAGPSWEQYVNDPAVVAEADLITLTKRWPIEVRPGPFFTIERLPG